MLRGRRNRRRVDQAAVRAAAASFAVRAGRMLALVIGLTALALATAWGGARAKRWLYTSPTFAVERVAFEGLSHATETELLRLGEIRLGDNIFEADLPAAARMMATHPWVRRIALEREYPRTISVRVVEHQPAALADLGGLYYVDGDGKAFKKLAPGEEADLPILVGFDRDEYVAMSAEVERLFREALAALAAHADAGLERRFPVSEIRVDRVEGLTLFGGKEAAAVKLGFGEYPEKFARLDKLLAELSRRGASAEVIHLDNRTRPGRVAVQVALTGAGGKQ